MIQTKTRPGNIELLEDLFRRYPDIPQEVPIKQDMLCRGVRLSSSALEAAATGVDHKAYDLFSHDRVKMADMPRQEYRKAPRYIILKGGPYKLRPIFVDTRISADSPYQVDVIDGRLKLLLDDQVIADVGYRPAFKYYSRYFPDGTCYGDVVTHASHIVPFRSCQFWGVKEECKFCDINENARQVKKFKVNTLKTAHLKVDQVATVANVIAEEVVEREGHPLTTNWMISGGTITGQLGGLTEDEFYLRYVEAVKWGGPRRWVMLAIRAKDKATFREYHYRGVDRPLCNLEVWDKRLFEWICPGKAELVGWEEWVKRLVDAVDIFGEFNVQCAFVSGMELAQPYGFKTVAEAVKSTTEGIKFLMSRGVYPSIHSWSREPGSYLERVQKQPLVVPLEYYLELFRFYYENSKRYRLPKPRRAAQSPELKVIAYHSITQDLVILREEEDYEEQALQALEQIGAIWTYRPQAA